MLGSFLISLLASVNFLSFPVTFTNPTGKYFADYNSNFHAKLFHLCTNLNLWGAQSSLPSPELSWDAEKIMVCKRIVRSSRFMLIANKTRKMYHPVAKPKQISMLVRKAELDYMMAVLQLFSSARIIRNRIHYLTTTRWACKRCTGLRKESIMLQGHPTLRVALVALEETFLRDIF